MEHKTLEKLTEQGWKFLSNFGDCHILSKGNERLLYHPKQDKIEFEYKVQEHAIPVNPYWNIKCGN